MKLGVRRIQARLRAAAVYARGSISHRDLVLVRIEDANGIVGHGEAAPLPGHTAAGIDDVRAALEDCRPVLAGDPPDPLAACARVAVIPEAIAAVDLALWDLAGRRAGQPVWKLLGASQADPVAVNALIAAPDRRGAARAAAAARAAGFGCIKVKVGIGDDAGRLAAVRAVVGPETTIRVDANGVWSVSEATAALRALAPVGIELCEEPVSGLEDTAAVAAASPVPVALDEAAVLPGALDRRVCELVCLKLVRCGGISGLLAAARQARQTGYGVYVASMFDGPLGIAGALHAAAALRPDRPWGLATLAMFEGRDDPLPSRAGMIAVPSGPGLGDGLLSWYQARV